ncbi:unnamed protein product, partial [Brugia timori]|uniref:Methyl-accepting chemotaxis protein n=1 Tax=Brugia timori TaxID=42155 RepID=A0A0R3QR08_9BILA
MNTFDGFIVKILVVCVCQFLISTMKNSRKAIKQRNGNSNDISVRITNTNAEISSDRSQQSISKNLSLTQEKSDSEQTQSTDEMESKTMNLTEISSKADELISKIS